MAETNLVRVDADLINKLKDMRSSELNSLGDVIRFLKNEHDRKDEMIHITLDREDAGLFHDELCSIPHRNVTSYDTEPPTEREEPIENVIYQLNDQLDGNDKNEM